MNRFALLVVLAALVVSTGFASAQTAYTIKLKERGEGEAVFVKKNEITNSHVVVTDGGGNEVLNQKELKKEIMEFKETILKGERGKAPTQVTRVYTKARAGKGDEIDKLPMEGKTVLIEKKAGKYVFSYGDGENVEAKVAERLTKDFSKKSDAIAEFEKLVLPTKAVRAGESWTIDMPKIVAELKKQGEMELDSGKATGKGTLVKAYKKDGQQFGELKFKMDIPLLTIGKEKSQLKFMDAAKITLDMTLDVCIDGTLETGLLKMKMKMTGNATVPSAPGAAASLAVIVDADQSREDVGKK